MSIFSSTHDFNLSLNFGRLEVRVISEGTLDFFHFIWHPARFLWIFSLLEYLSNLDIEKSMTFTGITSSCIKLVFILLIQIGDFSSMHKLWNIDKNLCCGDICLNENCWIIWIIYENCDLAIFVDFYELKLKNLGNIYKIWLTRFKNLFWGTIKYKQLLMTWL